MACVNCWEHTNCGRQTGGHKTLELGVCPAASEARTHGINHGVNGGRACWAIAGTFCAGQVQGSFASKMGNCFRCDFYKRVMSEEGADVMLAKDIFQHLR